VRTPGEIVMEMAPRPVLLVSPGFAVTMVSCRAKQEGGGTTVRGDEVSIHGAVLNSLALYERDIQ
jgi:hypothetical protein